MSYNVSTWTTKRIENLVIPLVALYNISTDLIARGYAPRNPKVKAIEDNALVVEIPGFGEAVARGKLRPDNDQGFVLQVSDICCYGEASGTFYSEVLLPALEQSRGRLEAVLIWASGDSISRLIVRDGTVVEENIEL